MTTLMTVPWRLVLWVGSPKATMATDQLSDLARRASDACVWGFGLLIGARVRQNLTLPADPSAPRPPSVPGAPINRFGHQQRLADPELTVGVGPNVDTLYSVAWLDLDAGPFVLETPDFGDRYYTFQIALDDTSCEFSYGQRTHGRQLPSMFIASERYAGDVPDQMLVVRAPGRYLMVGGRVLVRPDDQADFEAVYGLQRQMRLRTLDRFEADSAEPNPVSQQRLLIAADSDVPDDLRFFEELGNLVGEWVSRVGDDDAIAAMAPLGISREHGWQMSELSADQLVELGVGLRHGVALVTERSEHLGENVNGWTFNRHGPVFGFDALLRSAVAKDQVYVVPIDEAMYPVAAIDAAGEHLDGAHRYELMFAGDELPPVDAFWSLTMYDERGRLTANAIDRYAIGDRTTGLTANPDGGLTLLLQHDRPADAANWLPAPPGTFHVEFRLYHPQPAALDGTWNPPPIRRI